MNKPFCKPQRDRTAALVPLRSLLTCAAADGQWFDSVTTDASLRTQQQLGYIVSCGTNELFGVRALTFIVQSATTTPAVIEARIDDFVRSFRSALVAASEAEVTSLAERLAAQYTSDVDSRLDNQAGRLWTECLTQRYDFDR